MRAPSFGNTQPWEFSIVSGRKLEEIREACAKKAEQVPNSDLDWPQEFPPAHDARRRALGIKLLK